MTDNAEFDQAEVDKLTPWRAEDYLKSDADIAGYLFESLDTGNLSIEQQVGMLRVVILDAVNALSRRKDAPRQLKEGDVVQLSPNVGNPMFACCMMTVTEPKPWGAQGYVQMTGENGQPGGQAYYRATWDVMEYVGRAEWVLRREDESPDPQ